MQYKSTEKMQFFVKNERHSMARMSLLSYNGYTNQTGFTQGDG